MTAKLSPTQMAWRAAQDIDEHLIGGLCRGGAAEQGGIAALQA